MNSPIGAATYQYERRKPSQLAVSGSSRQTFEPVSWLPLHFRLFHFTRESCFPSDSVDGSRA
nr:unnamed protein product [Callosobruchus chinensis]